MGFRYELRTPGGDDAGTFESSVSDWQAGDEFRGAGNVGYRITAVIPLPLIEEVVDDAPVAPQSRPESGGFQRFPADSAKVSQNAAPRPWARSGLAVRRGGIFRSLPKRRGNAP